MRRPEGVNDALKRGVRKHHAPVGALRPILVSVVALVHGVVREHHAPVGALRPHTGGRGSADPPRQGAPRTCRCIETGGRIERGKEDKFSGTYETHGTKLGSSTAPPRFIYYAPFPLLRLLSLRYAPFPRTVKGEEA